MAKSLIYTCTGDAGSTSLVGGKRVRKNDIRIEAYGDIDELNSQLGALVAAGLEPRQERIIGFIQNKLFSVGAYLATESIGETPTPVYGLSVEDVEVVERMIDEIDTQLPPLCNFVLPGGCMAASIAHVCRTVCRRSERHIIALAETAYVDPLVLKFVNRLSDLLFVMARFCNISSGKDEIFWNKDCQL